MLDKIQDRVRYMKSQAGPRDSRMSLMRRVRAGDLEMVDPAAFSDLFPKPVVANFISNAAEDFANSVAPLPTLSCTAGNMITEKDKKRATKKNKAADSYWRGSRLDVAMFTIADEYDTYGFSPLYVEPDFTTGTPHIYADGAVGAYYERNRQGRVIRYAKCWYEKRGVLAAQFDDIHQLKPQHETEANADIEVTRYCDDNVIVLYTNCDSTSVVLASYANKAKRCPVAVAERPSLDREQRGRYDDAVWPQLARNRMRMYVIEAAEKAVHAPLQVGFDVTELGFGPDAVIQSEQPVRRVPIEVPSSVFSVEAQMQEETRVATKHPSARDGVSNASVITGRGVEALMGQFDGHIKAAQIMLGECLAEGSSLSFRVDEAYFGDIEREIKGTLSGESFVEKWKPSRDIDGDYLCTVDYGFASGLGTGQALVLMLQLLGPGLISKDTVRRNLPLQMDIVSEQRHIEIEGIQSSLLMAIQGMAQSLPQLASQGMDVSNNIRQIADIIRLRGQGKSLEESVAVALTPPEPTPEEAAAAEQQAPGAEAGVGGPPSPAEQGGPPDLQNLIAGIRNGQLITGANVQRRTPV